MKNESLLVLVDEDDRPVGKLEKSEVHRLGLLHRAFSIFIFNRKGELLLQQRADGKYHSAGLWTNTCCSHAVYGEEFDSTVQRRLQEEMGLRTGLQFAFSFIYKVEFDNGLIEHEFDHVYFGTTDDVPHPDKTEVKDWKYIRLNDLKNDLLTKPEDYSVWLEVCFNKVMEYFQKWNAD